MTTPTDDHDQQRDDEGVRRRHERDARFADAAQVHDRQEDENDQAQRERVRQKRRKGRHQRADAGGDADGDVQNVVEHQRGAARQPPHHAEVRLGDGVRTASARVRGDRLTVGKIDDEEHRDDDREDRPHVLKAGAPSGIMSVSAASGPYAADAIASSPSTGMPAAGPICWCTCSSDASRRPRSQSRFGIVRGIVSYDGEQWRPNGHSC